MLSPALTKCLRLGSVLAARSSSYFARTPGVSTESRGYVLSSSYRILILLYWPSIFAPYADRNDADYFPRLTDACS
jgi:hypothetical protein